MRIGVLNYFQTFVLDVIHHGGDTQILLKELFRSDKRGKKTEKNAELTRQAGGNRNPWPANDPNWDYNNAGDRANCQTAFGIQWKLSELVENWE